MINYCCIRSAREAFIGFHFSAPPLVIIMCAFLFGCPENGLGQVYPDIEVSTAELDFGNVPVLHNAGKEIRVANRGRAPLAIRELKITGDDEGVFSFGEFSESIQVGAKRTLALDFRPEDESEYQSILRIHSDDPERPVVEVLLSGEGRTISAIEIEPESIYFGLVGEGVMAVETFTVHSTGTAPLIVEELNFEEGSPEEFSAVGSWSTPAEIEAGSSAELSVSFTPVEGQEITEGAILIKSTDPFNRTIRLALDASVNRAPLAICGEEEILRAPGDIVILDGSGSYDPDGHEPLTYRWEVLRRPLTSLTELEDARGPTPSIELDVAGTWEISLSVRDALDTESISPCRVMIRSVPAERLFIELVWTHSLTDLDLHVLGPGGELFGNSDCWWGNPQAFGCEHSGDDLAGFGPEWARIPDPEPGTYRVKVRFAKTNGADDPVTEATVRVYQYGVLEAEMRRSLVDAGLIWKVLDIEWPSGRINPVNEVMVH